jgi:hypothetical protein
MPKYVNEFCNSTTGKERELLKLSKEKGLAKNCRTKNLIKIKETDPKEEYKKQQRIKRSTQ